MPRPLMETQARRAIVVMGRLPVPGQVKTRLAADLGHEVAAELYQAFLLDVFELVERSGAARESALVFSVAVRIDEELEAARDLLPSPAWRLAQQRGATLGEKIEDARAQAGAKQVLILGSDAPHMPPERLDAAFAALAETGVDAVLGPTADGGYDLIAFGRPCPMLLDGIPWSSPQVMEATRQAAQRAGLRIVELSPGRDIDDLADLEAMLEALRHAASGAARRSRAAAERALVGRSKKPQGPAGGNAGSR